MATYETYEYLVWWLASKSNNCGSETAWCRMMTVKKERLPGHYQADGLEPVPQSRRVAL